MIINLLQFILKIAKMPPVNKMQPASRISIRYNTLGSVFVFIFHESEINHTIFGLINIVPPIIIKNMQPMQFMQKPPLLDLYLYYIRL